MSNSGRNGRKASKNRTMREMTKTSKMHKSLWILSSSMQLKKMTSRLMRSKSPTRSELSCATVVFPSSRRILRRCSRGRLKRRQDVKAGCRFKRKRRRRRRDRLASRGLSRLTLRHSVLELPNPRQSAQHQQPHQSSMSSFD